MVVVSLVCAETGLENLPSLGQLAEYIQYWRQNQGGGSEFFDKSRIYFAGREIVIYATMKLITAFSIILNLAEEPEAVHYFPGLHSIVL
jgi:hypothetical protein